MAATTGVNAGNRSLDQIDIQAGLHQLDAKPCKKFEFPDPLKHQCQRATSQAPASSRPRTSNKSDQADTGVTALSPALRNDVATVVANLPPDLRKASRRSYFWSIYAYSARLRN